MFYCSIYPLKELDSFLQIPTPEQLVPGLVSLCKPHPQKIGLSVLASSAFVNDMVSGEMVLPAPFESPLAEESHHSIPGFLFSPSSL